MSRSAFSDNLRPVELNITVGENLAFPLDAYKSVIAWVEQIETLVASGTVSSLRDLDLTGGSRVLIKSITGNRTYTVTISTMAVDGTPDYSIIIDEVHPTYQEAFDASFAPEEGGEGR